MSNTKKVLFLCTGNSCRSQMAEGFLRFMAGSGFEVFSAGTEPSPVNPFAIQVMRELGIDISGQTSKSVDIYKDKSFDFVVTACNSAKSACPVFPGKSKHIHWDLEDPAKASGTDEQKLTFFRDIRDKISKEIRHFIKHHI